MPTIKDYNKKQQKLPPSLKALFDKYGSFDNHTQGYVLFNDLDNMIVYDTRTETSQVYNLGDPKVRFKVPRPLAVKIMGFEF